MVTLASSSSFKTSTALTWDYDPDDPQIHQNDHTFSLCPDILELEENIYAPQDDYRIIIMTAVEVIDSDDEFDDDGNFKYMVPDGFTVVHGKPLDVVEMNCEWE